MVDILDVKIFLRVPHETLKQRREERSGYATAGMPCLYDRRSQPSSKSPTFSPCHLLPFSILPRGDDLLAHGEQLTAEEGTFWKDPPGYWYVYECLLALFLIILHPLSLQG